MAIIDEVEGLTIHSFSLEYSADTERWRLEVKGTPIRLEGNNPDHLVLNATLELSRRDSRQEEFPLLSEACSD